MEKCEYKIGSQLKTFNPRLLIKDVEPGVDNFEKTWYGDPIMNFIHSAKDKLLSLKEPYEVINAIELVLLRDFTRTFAHTVE